MKTKKKKYLPLYERWAVSGFMSDKGLCGLLGDDFRNIFRDNDMSGYWGYDGREIFGAQHNGYGLTYKDLTCKFTPLRQNMVLFLAAMNDEL